MSSAAEAASTDLPVRRTPDVGWAHSPVMQRLMRDLATTTGTSRTSGPTGIAGERPYVPQAISRASRVVVIGRRSQAARTAA